MAISIERPCRRTLDFKNCRWDIRSSQNGQAFHYLPVAIFKVKKIERKYIKIKINRKKKEKNFNNSCWIKDYNIILRVKCKKQLSLNLPNKTYYIIITVWSKCNKSGLNEIS